MPRPSAAPLRRSALFGALCLLLGMMLLTRTVGLHWHAHLGHPSGLDAPAGLHHGTYSLGPVYVADLSTPHVAEDGDEDISLTGELGLQTLALALPVITALSLWSVILQPVATALTLPWSRSAHSAFPPRLAANRLPPLRAPPAFR